MTDEFEPSEQTRRRVGLPARAAIVVFAGFCVATFVRQQSTGYSILSALGLIGLCTLTGPGLAFLLASWVGDSDHPWGLLPFAEGQVRGVSATCETQLGVILRGVHPEFVAATREAQRKAT